MTDLWDDYKPSASSSTSVLAIVQMVNEKYRERIPAWECFIAHPEHFPFLLNHVFRLSLDDTLSFLEQTELITFLDNCFNSLEVDVIRQEVIKTCSLPIWISLLPKQRSRLLDHNTKLKKFWSKVEKKTASMAGEELQQFNFNRYILWRLLDKFKRTIDRIDDDSKEFDVDAVMYCERFLLLLIDMEAQLTIRRFFHVVLLASHVITHCHLSQLITTEYGSIFCELLTMLKFYTRFEIDDVTGMPLTSAEMTKRHYDYVTNLQKASLKHFPNTMMDFAFLNVGSVDTRKFLQEHFCKISAADLYKIANYLELVTDEAEHRDANYARYDDAAYLREMIIFYCERRPSQLQKLNAQPLYPPETVIWDEKLVPYEEYDGKSVLPLNKLNLQFLTLHDYLLRNFNLFQMESTYEIRQDLEDALFRMRPYRHESGSDDVVWGGWSRMALPVAAAGCRIVWVAKPLVGETSPAEVKADVTVTLPTRMDLRLEWERLRRNDVLFMTRVRANQPYGTKFDRRKPFKEQFRVELVRGCEIEGFLGPDGKVVEEMESREVLKKMTGDLRTIRVKFDPNQYQLDMENHDEKADLYYTFNLVLRRDPKTNNFKAVLATIRQLLNTECVVPDWLHDIILGYGEPDAAHYTKMTNVNLATLNFNDTFLTFDHLKASFPGKEIVCDHPQPPFKLTFKELVAQHDIADAAQHDTSIVVEPQSSTAHLSTAAAGIEGFEKTRRNAIQFTPAQVEAIRSGMQPGLTVVVGPPGTGKTDVAVQIISNIYHNWPEQRTLIVTHSNQALNQLFEKIIALDVDERHLLRMGHGEETLETEKDFSCYGRVNYVLTERNALLKRVERLSEILGEVGDVSYSCETAGYFYRYTVVRKWNQFTKYYANAAKPTDDDKVMEVDAAEEKISEAAPSSGIGIPADWVANNFPFSHFFGDNLFKCESAAGDFIIAEACYTEIQKIFFKLEEFLAFELLRNGRDRADYLLVKEAKIIAMTCTHAALRRKELVNLGFRYDNILMEESAQILEVETFIPLLLQNPRNGQNRLKRWIMIGDHNQLPPVVQNVAYQKYSNMEQSLFTRFIRLGVPHIQLDAQGRARAEIAQLYSWQYKNLGNLPHVQQRTEYQLANPGFLYNFQLIDVLDFNGVGESTPSPYFYQNLGEAEFAVALFVYMRVIGYPANRISIITTYNGQASLIRDVATKRCGENPLIGMPGQISTVDKYQGKQNDYVILSLVRTRFVGHLRDVRRLIVALSRARLGLYVLGRVNLFRNCHELKPAFKRLLTRPTRLALTPHESFEPESRRKNDEEPSHPPMEIVDTHHISLFVHEFYKSNVELLKKRFIDEFGEDVLIKAATAAHAKVEERNGMPRRKRQPQVQIHRAKQLPIPSGGSDATASGTATVDISSNDFAEVDADASSAAETKPAGEKSEGVIIFEQVDFERLQDVPKY